MLCFHTSLISYPSFPSSIPFNCSLNAGHSSHFFFLSFLFFFFFCSTQPTPLLPMHPQPHHNHEHHRFNHQRRVVSLSSNDEFSTLFMERSWIGVGRPAKEIVWDESYTGPLKKCAYAGHEELWGADVPIHLQPQYFYQTTARCIYCYK